MRYILIVCLLVATPLLSCAQREMLWQPDTTLHLDVELPYNRVTIIDARTNRETIGWLKTGAFNRYADLVTADSLSHTLSLYASHIIRTAKTQPGELLLVIKSFRIEDRKGAEEIGTVHIRADEFINTGTGYMHSRNIDTFCETKSGWDVTKLVQQLGSEVFVGLLSPTTGIPPLPKTYTLDEALGREEMLKKNWAAYNGTPPVRGIYHTCDDFLRLQTTDTDFIDQHIAAMEGNGITRFYRMNERRKKGDKIEPEDCFAIYDGKRWHKSTRDGFTEMVFEHGDYYATMRIKGFTDNSLVMGIMFGAMGSAIASGDRKTHYTPYRTRFLPESCAFAPISRIR